MDEKKSATRRVGEKLLMPIVAAGTSAAAGYVVKKGPGFVEEKVLPRVREAVQGAGGVAEKLPDQARSAVSGGGELAEQLTQKARDVTGLGDGDSGDNGDSGDSGAGARLSPKKLSERTEERARHRAKRRKATKSK
jgi:hypothetical protein